MKQPDAKQWKVAINTEFAQLERLGVFSEPCWLPEGYYANKSRTLFEKKRSKTGALEHWKSRLVAQKFLQSFGFDFFDTYTSVARMASFRVIYALSVYLHQFIESVDVDVTFLNAELKEDLYGGIQTCTEGYDTKTEQGVVWSPREWIWLWNGIWLWTSSYGRILN